MLSLYEQYRPTTWADVVGQPKVVARIQLMAKRGLTGRAFWLTGASGTGKSTIARLIAAELGGAILLECLGMPTDADLGGCYRYVQSYASAAEIDLGAACRQCLERTCKAVDFLLTSAEKMAQNSEVAQ